MLTSNNMAKVFKKLICDGDLQWCEGFPYGICNKLTRITTELGVNEKFLICSSDNGI